MDLLRKLARGIPPLEELQRGQAAIEELDTLKRFLNEAAKTQTSADHSPIFQHAAIFDAEAVVLSHAAQDPKPRTGYLTNYLGVLVDPKIAPQLAKRGGAVEGPPIPANWHADLAEWAGALRAVDLASDTFTVVELGCGWGCWINNTGVAARRRGLKPRLIGIEGDAGHLAFAREACAINGFAAGEVELLHGIAGGHSGIGLFPRQDRAGESWGLEAVFNPSEAVLAQARAEDTHVELPLIDLAEATRAYPRIDLLHMDIQGAEVELVETCLSFLTEKVAYLVIGAHSREIEGRLIEILKAAGWRLEVDRPAIYTGIGDQIVLLVDGVQAWRNPRLTA